MFLNQPIANDNFTPLLALLLLNIYFLIIPKIVLSIGNDPPHLLGSNYSHTNQLHDCSILTCLY